MPFFDTQSRDQLRRVYIDAWRKRREGLPMEPLEAQVADVIEDVVTAYVEFRARPDELFIDTVKRIGVEPFKERVYAAAQ